MTLNQSLIQPYTDAFVAAIDAATAPDVFVTDGPPPASYMQAGKVVWVGDAIGQQTLIALGSPTNSGPKEEMFTLQVHISIYGPTSASATNTHQLQGQEAFTILEAINAKLRLDQSLGLTPEANPHAYVTLAETRSPIAVKKGGTDQARETSVSFGVFVQGYLE